MLSLQDRKIIKISGSDKETFLQGLITNDINLIKTNKIIYSAMLNSKGRFLYDFFIFSQDDNFMLDCLDKRRDEIIKKLSLYKLRSDVNIQKDDEIKVFVSSENNEGFIDPRNSKMPRRIYQKYDDNVNSEETKYHQQRITLKIPESEYDLTYEKSIILEFDFDNLNAVSYTKGCYIGQELTARTHHLGQVRKKIFHAKTNSKNLIEKNSKITCEGKSIGIILSSVIINDETHCLALIKLEEGNKDPDFNKNFECDSNRIFIIN